MQRRSGEQTQQRISNGPLVQSERELRARAAHHPQQAQHRDERAARDKRWLYHQLDAIANLLSLST